MSWTIDSHGSFTARDRRMGVGRIGTKEEAHKWYTTRVEQWGDLKKKSLNGK